MTKSDVEKIGLPQAETILHTATSCREPLYHTCWLMAHNAFKAAVEGEFSSSLTEAWEAYLKELETAEEIAKRPA